MFNYNEAERKLLSAIIQKNKLTGYEELKYCVQSSIMAPFQTSVIAYGLINKKCILAPDTGLGKTLIGAGLINVIASFELGKWVIVCPLFNMRQTVRKLNALCYGKKIVSTSNAQSDIDSLVYKMEDGWDILVTSYQSITNDYVQKLLLSHMGEIKGMIVDESQLLANLTGSASTLINSMCRAIDYVFFLSATPIRVAVSQFIKQIYMLNRDAFGMPLENAVRRYTLMDEEGKAVGIKNLEELTERVKLHYISVTRAELGIKGEYRVHPIVIHNIGMYQDVARKDIALKIKGDLYGPALRRLISVVKSLSENGKRGLVYINRNINKKNTLEIMKRQGILADVYDGSITDTKKKQIAAEERFLNGETQCLITNKTMGLDLTCDYIISYELTFDFKQLLGRGERGLEARDLDIYFILVDNTEEIGYFIDNVYLKAQWLGVACGKDVTELDKVYKAVNHGVYKPDTSYFEEV